MCFLCLDCMSLAKKSQLALRSGDAEAAWVAAGRSSVSLNTEDFKMVNYAKAIRGSRRGRGRSGRPGYSGFSKPRERTRDAQVITSFKEPRAKSNCWHCQSRFHLERNCPDLKRRN